MLEYLGEMAWYLDNFSTAARAASGSWGHAQWMIRATGNSPRKILAVTRITWAGPPVGGASGFCGWCYRPGAGEAYSNGHGVSHSPRESGRPDDTHHHGTKPFVPRWSNAWGRGLARFFPSSARSSPTFPSCALQRVPSGTRVGRTR